MNDLRSSILETLDNIYRHPRMFGRSDTVEALCFVLLCLLAEPDRVREEFRRQAKSLAGESTNFGLSVYASSEEKLISVLKGIQEKVLCYNSVEQSQHKN